MHKKIDLGAFSSYVVKFEDYSAIYAPEKITVTDLVIEFGNLDGEEAGECETFEFQSPKITVDEEWWDDVDTNEAEHEILLFHELGHCILNRDHNNNFLPSGIEESIMYYRVINSDNYIDNREYYLKELFNGR